MVLAPPFHHVSSRLVIRQRSLSLSRGEIEGEKMILTVPAADIHKIMDPDGTVKRPPIHENNSLTLDDGWQACASSTAPCSMRTRTCLAFHMSARGHSAWCRIFNWYAVLLFWPDEVRGAACY